MRDQLTPDGRSFTSAASLARCVNVHRDQVRMWRLHEGAPADLTLATWRQWLAGTGRLAYAEAIPAVLAGADEAPPAGGTQQTLADVPDVKAEDEAVWKARHAKARALIAERELAESEGRLVERAAFVAALRRMGAAVLETLLAARAWDALAPELDGLTPAQRRAIHAAYERWMLDLRGRLALIPAGVASDILPPQQSAPR